MEEHADELAELEAIDNGKPKVLARAADVGLLIDVFRYMAGWATKIEGMTNTLSQKPIPDARFFAYTRKEPVGVAGQIIPWNFPLFMLSWKVAPALAAGCTVVLKPAEQTPLSALRVGELMMEAGFPDGVINIVPGYGETAGAALAAHPDVDKIAFTGSTEVGKLILDAARGNLKKVSLELGGKSPNIVMPDADLETAIAGASSAIFYNAGQSCAAGSRLYVHKKIYDDVVSGVADAAQNIKVGDWFDPEAEMGPLVSREQLERVTKYIDSGLSDGAHAVTGGGRIGDKGYFFEPTVMVDAKPSMKIVQEEIFGPVVAAIPFESEEELIQLANASSYGLAAGVWTNDVTKALRITDALNVGTVWINTYSIVDAALPFGGYKQSGWGRESGREGVELYTETKSVCIQY
jgi:phenylacetaldehyde dehydrogenase